MPATFAHDPIKLEAVRDLLVSGDKVQVVAARHKIHRTTLTRWKAEFAPKVRAELFDGRRVNQEAIAS